MPSKLSYSFYCFTVTTGWNTHSFLFPYSGFCHIFPSRIFNTLDFLLYKHFWSSFRPLWWGRPEVNTTQLHAEGEFLTQPAEKWPTSWNSWRIPRLFCNFASGYECLRYESDSILNISSATNNYILSSSRTFMLVTSLQFTGWCQSLRLVC